MRRAVPQETLKEGQKERLQENKREREAHGGTNVSLSERFTNKRARTVYLVISDNCWPADGKNRPRSGRTKSKTQDWLHKAANQRHELVFRRSRTDNSPSRLVSKALSGENISEYVLKADRSE